MSMTMQRIQGALKVGREIDVIEDGGDHIMTAFEHPYRTTYDPNLVTGSTTLRSDEPQRNSRKVRCYWYRGDEKQVAIFNLENLKPVQLDRTQRKFSIASDGVKN